MHYRLYALDQTSGRITTGQDIRATTDAEALRIGRETYRDAPFEIWCGTRRVVTSGRGGA